MPPRPPPARQTAVENVVEIAEHVRGIHPRFAAGANDSGTEDANEEDRAHFEDGPESDVYGA